MSSSASLSTAEILAVFGEEIAARRGQVTDIFDDGERLLTRSVLPYVEEVRAGDRLQGGVALKKCEEGVWLHPYLFRLVCQNGAIVAQTLDSRFIEDLLLQEQEAAVQAIREGVEACCDREVFAETMRKARSACEVEADLALNMLPLISRFSGPGNAGLLPQIMERFFQEPDQSRFGLANAITALARDTRDPDLRWDLEEFGGGVAIGAVPSHPADGGSRVIRPRSRQLAFVG